MKMGFFSDTYLPTIHGVNVSIESFRKELEKEGHEVYIFTPYIPGYKDANPRVFRLRSLPFLKNPEIRIGLPTMKNSSLRKIVNIKLDIVHAHTPFNLGLLARYVARKQKIPLVYTHHTRISEEATAYFKSKKILPRLARSIYVSFANKNNAVIAPSEGLKNILEKEGVRKPIYVLPTGVDLHFFGFNEKSEKESRHIREKFGITPQEKVLIFVGRLDPEKNVEFLIESFGKLLTKYKEIKFLIVGSGFHENKLKQYSKDIPSGHIVFAGSVPFEKMPFYYQAADAFVFSSPTETQGLVILEAMASGLPIVAVKNRIIDNLIESGKNGYLLDSFDTGIFAEKVLDIISHPEIQKKYSRASLEVAADFSVQKQTARLLEIYNQLIGKKNALEL
ncbi:MAG: glycosyltransferase [Candidatus Moranbacteria bacterium]|nr:glycosyltransferase [Candidatus Moranbacteria bacterium]